MIAKKYNGDFILRIEDTDSKREVNGSIEYMLNSLEWIGIKFNEGYGIGGKFGPYIQSERKDIYKKYVDYLINNGYAYYAFDTPEELDNLRNSLNSSGLKSIGYSGSVRDRMKNSLSIPKTDVDNLINSGFPYVVRFKVPKNENIKFKDEIRGWVTFNTNDLDDKVIWKSSDQNATYHLANIVDDYLMEITHVIRGEEWVSSTPLHILLYKALGWEHPIFAHLPLILGPDKKKLGKRNKYGIPVFALDWTYTDPEGEVVDIKGFCEAGYEPDALINYLALLGWNPGGNIEHMSMAEMIDLFSIERVNNSGAMFDLLKLNSFNSHYLRSRHPDVILENMTSMPEEFLFSLDDTKMDLIAKMAVERAIFSKDLRDAMSYLWNAPSLDGELNLKNINEFERVMNVFTDDYVTVDVDWTPEHIKHELEFISNNMGIKIGMIMPMLRLALSGGAPGPQLPDVMYIIGFNESKIRINALLDKIRELA